MTYRFGPFLADRTAYRVFEGDRALELTPKLLDLLFHLLERPATLVTKEALLEAVWPGANVTDNALAQAISDLRDALGDEPSSPTYIRTVARRGYRFVAPVVTRASLGNDSGTRAPEIAEKREPESMPGPRTIAVLDFTNVSGDADVAWLSAGIAETVSSDLAALDEFHVVDRWRVVRAARQAGLSLHDVGGALGADLLVTGSYQRSGSMLRVTARVVDLASGAALADAKVDGALADVFSLQDDIVAAFARELHFTPARERRRSRSRETASLDAYRAYTEGWLKIETLDTDQVAAAVADFQRAIAVDPGYAMAHTGLANAEFVAFEMTRASRDAAADALTAGIGHARHAIRLDEGLAEAHATLSFLLVSATMFEEARASAERAVEIEPDGWRHQYRLGHACWGDARTRVLTRALALYPQFAYAHFELAVLHVARGHFDVAERTLRDGIASQETQARSGHRFPAIGFHWLLGALQAVRGNHRGAIEQFEAELARSDRRRLYGPEYAALALVGRGHAELDLGDVRRAIGSFRAALEQLPEFPRARLGVALALARLGDRAGANAARQEVTRAVTHLQATNRPHDARLIAACDAAVHGEPSDALVLEEGFLDLTPPSFLGWTLPIEPTLRPLRSHPGFAQVLTLLGERAAN